MIEVPESASDTTTELDEPVDGLGATVAGPVGIEVRQDRRLPLPQSPAQPDGLRDRTRRQGLDDAGRELAALGESVLVEHVTDVLPALVGDLNSDMILMRDERRLQTRLLPAGEAFASGPQGGADAVEEVAPASTVSERLLLDTMADIIDGAGGELDDVEGIEHAGGVFQLIVDRVLVPLERVQSRDLDSITEGGAARVEPVLVNRPGASRDEVQQAGCGVSTAGEIDHAG